MRAAIFRGMRVIGISAILRFQKKNAVTILCFHRVSNETDHVWAPMKIAVFDKLLRYCKKHYAIITPQQLNEKTLLPKMMLTFDDGYYDFIENALPLLVKYNVPCVHHVVVDSVLNNRPNWTYRLNTIVDDHLKSGKILAVQWKSISYASKITLENASRESMKLFHLLKPLPVTEIETLFEKLMQQCVADLFVPRMMNVADLQLCEKSGIEIGSHSTLHTILSEAHNGATLKAEVCESKTTLEKLLSHQVKSFAFPAGSYDTAVVKIATEAGYDFLFTTDEKLFYEDPAAVSPFLFPRLLVPSSSADEAILYIEMFHRSLRRFL